jgi:serine-type D-Ala-D-Ala carboxypeptidase
LEKARGDVFPSYAVGVHVKNENHFATDNCDLESLFDLASLTKVICTTTIAALAEQKKLLSVSDTAQSYFPNFKDKRVLLSHLLNHSSGLPAWLALHSHFHAENGKGNFNPITTPLEARVRYEEEILKCDDPAAFEKQIVYSDLGFMLLGWALEKKFSMPLDAIFQEWIATPLKFKSLQFLPVSPNVVPTENCPWRGHILRGEVHDDNCSVLGGIAAHAGLFGNVKDTLRAGVLWLKDFQGEETLLTKEIVQKYWSFTHIPGTVRTLGWDGVTPGSSSTGKYFSPSSKGHLGYTGTSLWIDPEKNLIVTLLTNRVHPSRKNENIKTFRPLFHDTLLEEIGSKKT